MTVRHLLSTLCLLPAPLLALPAVTYNVDSAINEGNPSIPLGAANGTPFDVRFSLTEPAPASCVFQFTARSSSRALAGRDYEIPATGHTGLTVTPAGVIVLDPGVTSATLRLKSIADRLGEPDELLAGAFTGPVNCTIPSPNWNLVIEDNDRCLYAVMKSFTSTSVEIVIYDDRFRVVTTYTRDGLFGTAPSFRGRPSLALADIANNDSVPEIIVGSGEGPVSRFHVYQWYGLPGPGVPEVYHPFGQNDTGGCIAVGGDFGGGTTLEDVAVSSGNYRVTTEIRFFSNSPLNPALSQSGSFGQLPSPGGYVVGGWVPAAGDLNNDGIGDLIYGNGPEQNRVSIASAVLGVFPSTGGGQINHLLQTDTFTPLGTHTNGIYISAGDWNGDGCADVATGLNADLLPGPSLVNVYDMKNRQVPENFYVTTPADGLFGGAYVAMSPRPHYNAAGATVSSLPSSPINLPRPGIVRYSDASTPLNVPASLLGGPIAAWTPRQDRPPVKPCFPS